ncbi:radical SAM protein [Methylotenera sp.]|uniref:radical SAM protein n=1 Tax=Methylotenera sp. TaxID=2051956 RepID=UPI0027317098|nr:radical SAM protein [Methylotenera sp.]MDP2071099.1 radical SAM protein [Methylotenera sp.]MDP3006328.1 radical SAM protein [Methylotenera sp.]
MTIQNFLTVSDHNRDVGGMKYIYPVVSRRAGGVSIGINLNINNACNWRCVYCQVPNLTRGTPPPIELDVLERELRTFLSYALHGDFMERYVAVGDRHIKDIAFSGNGEPTSAKEFPEVVLLVEKVLTDFNLLGDSLNTKQINPIKIRVITNGSLMDKPAILASISHLAKCNGEVWFKIDAGTKEGIVRINDVNLNPQSHLQRLKNCAKACPTFIQTCMFALDGQPPSESDISAYLTLISQVKDVVQGVHLYGLARPSYQAEAPRLSRLSVEWLEGVAERIRQLGLDVYVNP